MNPPILADFDEIGVVTIGHKYSGHGEVSDRMGTSKTSLTKWFDHDHNNQQRKMKLEKARPDRQKK